MLIAANKTTRALAHGAGGYYIVKDVKYCIPRGKR